MKRTRSAARGALVGLATAAIATLAVASVLVLTRYPVYRSTSTAAHPAVAAGAHALVQKDRTAVAGDVVVFRDSRHADDQIGRLGADTVAGSDVVGVVTRQGSLPSIVLYLLERAALLGVPLGLLVGLVVAVGLPSRRRPAPHVAELTVAATDVVPQQRADDWDAALADEGLDLVLTAEPAAREI